MFSKIKEFLKHSAGNGLSDFVLVFANFQEILQGNNRVLEMFAELEDMSGGEYIFDKNYLLTACAGMSEAVHKIIYNLNMLSGNRYAGLFDRYEIIRLEIQDILEGKTRPLPQNFTDPYPRAGKDQEQLIGGKNANLCEIQNSLGLRIPQGFAITVSAYHSFLQKNNLYPEICAIHERDLPDSHKDAAIHRLFAEAVLPREVEKEIAKELSVLGHKIGKKTRVALRSSACGEDKKGTSFAGQFLSLLNQKKEEVFPAYKRIVESRFLTSALSSPKEACDKEDVIPMAVACQEMIAGQVSGVVYTVDPAATSSHYLLISAVYGLGAPAVSGRINTDQYLLSRIHPFSILSTHVTTKETMLVLAQVSGVEIQDVPPGLQKVPCLQPEQMQKLAEIAMEIELYFKSPQDIEWTLDHNGEFVILQARPLFLCRQNPRLPVSEEKRASYPVIFNNKGQIVQRGIAVGKVQIVAEEDDPSDFPLGSIAVARYATPRLSKIIRKAAAIITDIGSSTGHLATVAREFGVPAIFGTSIATTLLKTGMEVSVDCEENAVYRGIIEEFIQDRLQGQHRYTELPEYKMLRKILGRIAPLNLFDPTSKDFTIQGCRTYHDIVRFSHEKAISELLNFHTQQQRFRKLKSREMKLSIPLGLDVIDLGQGLTANVPEREIQSIDQVNSIPMKAILRGLTRSGVWDTNPKSLQFGDLMSSMTRFSLDDAPEYIGRNMAVISDHYTNLSLRLGYHFTVVDTYLTDNLNDNYIYFRFVGGVTETERRRRRAILLKHILEKYDFKVMIKNDLVVAKIKMRESQELQDILTMLGKLIGFTRQLDTQMVSEDSIPQYVKVFEELESRFPV